MALYYPYIHFQDERWLKVAALYWPHIVRIVSSGHQTRDSRLVTVLKDELGFVVDYPPEADAHELTRPFAELIAASEPDVLRRLSVPKAALRMDPAQLGLAHPPSGLDKAYQPSYAEIEDVLTRQWSFGTVPTSGAARALAAGLGLAAVHHSEVSPELTRLLIEAGLAAPARGEWLVMNSALTWLYKCRLTEETARRNNLVPATDQLSAHAVMSGPVEIESLDDQGSQRIAELTKADLQTRFGLLALEAVVPRDLGRIPVEEIVKIRRRFARQFDRWRQYADAVGAELAEELKGIDSPAILDTYLADAVRRFATAPVDDLKRGLAEVGVDATTLAVNTKFEVPPALAMAGAAQPHVAAVGGIALGVLSLRRATRLNAQAKQTAPAAYLLNVQETLASQTWLMRIIMVMRRAAGLRD